MRDGELNAVSPTAWVHGLDFESRHAVGVVKDSTRSRTARVDLDRLSHVKRWADAFGPGQSVCTGIYCTKQTVLVVEIREGDGRNQQKCGFQRNVPIDAPCHRVN